MADKINWEAVEMLTEQFGSTAKTFFYGAPAGWDDPKTCDLKHTIVADRSVDIQPRWNVPDKIVVSTALTGSFFRKSDNPNQPVTVDEIYTAGKEVCEAGGQVIHIHVRDDNERNVIDIDRFEATIGRLKSEYPDRMFECCIVPRYPGDFEKMLYMLDRGLTETVTVNTVAAYIGDMLQTKGPQVCIKKTKAIIEHGCKPRIAVYTDGDIDNANRWLIAPGLIDKHSSPTHWGILPAMPGCSPMHNPVQMVEGLLHLQQRIKDIDPDAVIQVCAAGRAGGYLANLAAILGFNVRIGMEDTFYKYPHKDEVITNNAQHFREFKQVCQWLGRDIATPNEYRAMIGLPLK